jgi:hypothetical protein
MLRQCFQEVRAKLICDFLLIALEQLEKAKEELDEQRITIGKQNKVIIDQQKTIDELTRLKMYVRVSFESCSEF